MTTLFDDEAQQLSKVDPKWNTPTTLHKLMEMFPAPEYAFLKEVAKGTGGHGGRYADAIVMSLYPSRGLYLSGFEIKTSRSDWLNELKNPKKSDDIAKFCDFWYLVVGSNSIVKDNELPFTWGLIEPVRGKLKVTKKPEKIDCLPLTRSFLAAVMRRSNEKVGSPEAYDQTIKQAAESEFQRGAEWGKNWNKNQVDIWQKEVQKYKERIKTFEEISGVNIDSYDGKRIAEAVKLHLEGGFKHLQSEIESIQRKAKGILEFCEVIENHEKSDGHQSIQKGTGTEEG